MKKLTIFLMFIALFSCKRETKFYEVPLYSWDESKSLLVDNPPSDINQLQKMMIDYYKEERVKNTKLDIVTFYIKNHKTSHFLESKYENDWFCEFTLDDYYSGYHSGKKYLYGLGIIMKIPCEYDGTKYYYSFIYRNGDDFETVILKNECNDSYNTVDGNNELVKYFNEE